MGRYNWRRSRGEPLDQRLPAREEKRILTILGRLPRTEPPVRITPYEGEPFAVDYREHHDAFVPLVVGAEGIYADYDAATGEFWGANFLQVTRPVRVGGVWHLEAYETGGADLEDAFRLIWGSPSRHRREGDSARVVRSGWMLPLHLGPDAVIRWQDPETAEGPEQGEALPAGYATVEIGPRTFECLRVLAVWPEEGDPDEPAPEDEAPKWEPLDERFLTRDGRTALLRRFCTEERHREMTTGPSSRGDDPDWPAGRAHIRYNGVDFWHWFDILTDVSFGPGALTVRRAGAIIPLSSARGRRYWEVKTCA